MRERWPPVSARPVAMSFRWWGSCTRIHNRHITATATSRELASAIPVTSLSSFLTTAAFFPRSEAQPSTSGRRTFVGMN